MSGPGRQVLLGAVCWLWLTATAYCHNGLGANVTLNITTGQQFADAIAAFEAASDNNMTLFLANSLISLQNVTWRPAPINPDPAPTGTLLVKAADWIEGPIILDAAMYSGLLNSTQGMTHVTLHGITIVNMCSSIITADPSQAVDPSAYLVSLFYKNSIYQSHRHEDVTLYSIQRSLARTAYSALARTSPFPQIRNLTLPLYQNLPNGDISTRSVHPFNSTASYKLPSVVASNVTQASLANPRDPVLAALRKQGILMHPAYCNGTLFPESFIQARVHPNGPLWLTEESTDAAVALREAAAFSGSHTVNNTAMDYPPGFMITGNISFGVDTLPDPVDIGGPMIFAGPYNDVPEYAVLVQVDWADRTGVVRIGSEGQVFIQKLTFKGLAARQLPSTPDLLSALPLAAFTLPTSDYTEPSIFISNATLVLPIQDYLSLLALGVANTQDSFGNWKVANNARHTAAVNQGITQIQLSDISQDGSTYTIDTFNGFGISADTLHILPEQPLSVGAVYQTATPSGKHAGLTPRGIGLLILMIAFILALALVVALLWRQYRSRPGQVQEQKETARNKEVSKPSSSKEHPDNGKDDRSDNSRDPHLILQTRTSIEGSEFAAPSEDFNSTEQDSKALVKVANNTVLATTEHDTRQLIEIGRFSEAANVQLSHSRSNSVQYSMGATPVGLSSAGPSCSSYSPAGEISAHAGPCQSDQTGNRETATVSQAAGTSADNSEVRINIPEVVGQVPSQVVLSISPSLTKPLPLLPTTEMSGMLHQKVKQLAKEMNKDNDKVVVHGILGQGSTGTVFAGTWRSLPVALKTLVFQMNHSINGSPEDQPARVPAILEAAIAASVGHRNVVATYRYDIKPVAEDQTSVEGQLEVHHATQHLRHAAGAYKLFLVQELCACSLADAMERLQLRDDTGRTHEIAVVYLLLDIARGLHYLHTLNIIHGDLKPANILMQPPGGSLPRITAKLTDFGLSRWLDADATHVSNYRSGSPYYVAPEVIKQHQVFPASDIYSFGVIAWEVFTGLTPYVISTDPQTGTQQLGWNPDFPKFRDNNLPSRSYAQLCYWCLQPDPYCRPSAEEVVFELADIIKGQMGVK